jgi:hypothetical protein
VGGRRKNDTKEVECQSSRARANSDVRLAGKFRGSGQLYDVVAIEVYQFARQASRTGISRMSKFQECHAGFRVVAPHA